MASNPSSGQSSQSSSFASTVKIEPLSLADYTLIATNEYPGSMLALKAHTTALHLMRQTPVCAEDVNTLVRYTILSHLEGNSKTYLSKLRSRHFNRVFLLSKKEQHHILTYRERHTQFRFRPKIMATVLGALLSWLVPQMVYLDPSSLQIWSFMRR